MSKHEHRPTSETMIQVASKKRVLKEFRFWVVGGVVVTSSVYRTGDHVWYDWLVDDGALDFCREAVRLYRMADAFVLDVAMTPDGYRIVECNCLNSAGFYKADMQKLLMALEDFFGAEKPALSAIDGPMLK